MRFDVLERKWIINVLKYIQENLLGKCSNQEYEKILSDLVRKLQQSVQPEFSEIEKRIINILFLKIFSENEECLVVFEKLIQSLKNMRECLDFLAIYEAIVNEIFIDEIMKKSYYDLALEFYYSDTGFFTTPCVDYSVLHTGFQSLLQYLEEKLFEESTHFISEIKFMNPMIKNIEKWIQTLKSSNTEQLLEIIFSCPDELFPDFKSEIRELFTRWSIIQNNLLRFVDHEMTYLAIIIGDDDDDDDDEKKYSDPQFYSFENQVYEFKFRKDEFGQCCWETDLSNLESALELVRRNIHR
jgi:hypothetical protein